MISVAAGEAASHSEPDALHMGSFSSQEEHNLVQSHCHRIAPEREGYRGFAK